MQPFNINIAQTMNPKSDLFSPQNPLSSISPSDNSQYCDGSEEETSSATNERKRHRTLVLLTSWVQTTPSRPFQIRGSRMGFRFGFPVPSSTLPRVGLYVWPLRAPSTHTSISYKLSSFNVHIFFLTPISFTVFLKHNIVSKLLTR